MSDNLFTAVLTFSLMAAGPVAFGAEMVNGHRVSAQPTVCVTLDPVTVIGHRTSAAVASVTLPTVTVTGHKVTRVAAETQETATRFE